LHQRALPGLARFMLKYPWISRAPSVVNRCNGLRLLLSLHRRQCRAPLRHLDSDDESPSHLSCTKKHLLSRQPSELVVLEMEMDGVGGLTNDMPDLSDVCNGFRRLSTPSCHPTTPCQFYRTAQGRSMTRSLRIIFL
jgi:hypothetical protein